MTPWMDAINRLRSLGYSVTLRDERIRYAYQGKGSPPPDQVSSLIDVLTAHKTEIMNDPHLLIEQVLREINEGWVPGALDWIKRSRPSEWQNMIELEEKVNRLALGSDIDGLKKALDEYKELMLAMARAFKTPKGETRSLFQHG
jgi:hypothetical protein